jgi:hypothetical protein
MPMHRATSVLFGLLATAHAGCAAPIDLDDAEVARSEDELVSVPAGHYAIVSAPASSSHVSSATFGPGRSFELTFVRVVQTTEPWIWNPFVQVPVTKKTELALRGAYRTYRSSDGSVMISFDFEEGTMSHLVFELTLSPGALRLGAVGQRPYELRAARPGTAEGEGRVLRCQGHRFDARIVLAEAQRRRGTLSVTRNDRAGRTDPPDGQVEVVYTGDTGVRDYMAFVGRDGQGGSYDFALRRSDLQRRSGSVSNVGLGYQPPLAGGAFHNTLTCSIAME